MTREEAIAFLQDIKINLDYLQNHYAEERIQKQELAKVESIKLLTNLKNVLVKSNTVQYNDPYYN